MLECCLSEKEGNEGEKWGVGGGNLRFDLVVPWGAKQEQRNKENVEVNVDLPKKIFDYLPASSSSSSPSSSSSSSSSSSPPPPPLDSSLVFSTDSSSPHLLRLFVNDLASLDTSLPALLSTIIQRFFFFFFLLFSSSSYPFPDSLFLNLFTSLSLSAQDLLWLSKKRFVLFFFPPPSSILLTFFCVFYRRKEERWCVYDYWPSLYF